MNVKVEDFGNNQLSIIITKVDFQANSIDKKLHYWIDLTDAKDLMIGIGQTLQDIDLKREAVKNGSL